MKRFGGLLVVLLLLVALFGAAIPASAEAVVTSYFGGCGSLWATGTSTSPYVMFYAYNNDTGTELIVQAFPVSAGTFSFTVTFPPQTVGANLNYQVWGSPTDNAHAYDWDGEGYFYADAPCQLEPPPLVTSHSAPGIPSGFVRRTIICDVPVYNTQSGQPVDGAKITAGQSWYVNSTPVNGDDGRQWTEIFAGGYINGWVPTVCVA